MVVLLSRTSGTSLRTSEFDPLVIFWHMHMLFSIIYTFLEGGQVDQPSGQVKILFYLFGGRHENLCHTLAFGRHVEPFKESTVCGNS